MDTHVVIAWIPCIRFLYVSLWENNRYMIAEIKFKNMFSFRDETVLSFEADKSKDLESYHVVELAPDVKLLKLAVIYGANASGKVILLRFAIL